MTRASARDLADRLDAFAGAYAFLGGMLLAPPTALRLSRLAEPGMLDDWPMRPDEATTRGLLLLAAGTQEDPHDVAADHAQLFVGPGPLLVPPYESVYRTPERLLFEEPTMQVRAAYAEFGLQAPLLYREPDDHIGLELQFLCALCTGALDALQSGDATGAERHVAAHARFLVDHVLTWAEEFLDLLDARAETDLYRALAALTRGTVDQAAATFQP